jgi:hypothetical protein
MNVAPAEHAWTATLSSMGTQFEQDRLDVTAIFPGLNLASEFRIRRFKTSEAARSAAP